MPDLLQFAFGLGALVLGADVLVRGAARLALGWGLSPLVIGLTVVAFGTSAPEVAVSVGAALDGRTDIALGNVVGSNVFNILGILGVSALIVPLAVSLQVIRQEVPVMIGSALLLALLALDGRIGPLDGALLLGLLVLYTVFLVRQSRASDADANADFATDIGQAGATRIRLSVAMVLGGLGLLVVGAQALVAAATAFALQLGLSELVIGLTIVAVGTSLPELATSLMAAWRGQRDIAVGNVIGSCIFNILGCLGLTALVAGSAGLPVPAAVMRFDLWVMLAAALACLPVFITGRRIARWEGAVLLCYYLAYTLYLLMAAQQHAGIGAFSEVLFGFVAPLTLVAIVASLVRPPGPR